MITPCITLQHSALIYLSACVLCVVIIIIIFCNHEKIELFVVLLF